MSGAQVYAYLYGHFSDEVSKSTLTELLRLVPPDRRLALLGFTDYTKHVVNNFGDQIDAIFELDSRFVGFEFRGKPVLPISGLAERQAHYDELLICSFDDLVAYTDAVQCTVGHKPIRWPEDFDGKPGHKFDVRAQGAEYRYRDRPDRLGEPSSMMPPETITLLTELLRASLRVDGDIAEIGVWQGGSAWNMAKLMRHIGDSRPLHLFDFFDDHDRTNAEAIMCLDEIRARFGFYEEARFYRGFADRNMHDLADRRFCFVHIDLGYLPEVLDFFWSRLDAGGVMALDNYGHVRAWPTLFDRFFADRGYSVVRSPFSYQAFVLR